MQDRVRNTPPNDGPTHGTSEPERSARPDWRAALQNDYGLEGTLTRAGGENETHLVTTRDGRRFVWKVDGSDSGEDFGTQARLLEVLAASNLGLGLPQPIPTLEGAPSVPLGASPSGSPREGRLLSFVEGRAWREAPPASDTLLNDLGRRLAQLRLALESAPPPAAAEHRGAWDLTQAGMHRGSTSRVPDVERRTLLETAFRWFAAHSRDRLEELPQGWIHGDANDENVLVDGDRVVGLIDFGDALWNPFVCELAIALAYVLQHPTEHGAGSESGSPESLQALAPSMVQVLSAYDELCPLNDDELSLVFPLLCGRVATTLAVCAERRCIDPDRQAWFVSEPSSWTLLEALVELGPQAAERALRKALGRSPSNVQEESGASHPADRTHLLAARRRRIGGALSVAYDEPLHIVRGRGAYLFDAQGRAYLDLVNNVCHVGHCHPRVVAAGAAQMERLNTNTRYLYEGLTDYANRLCALLPDELDTCFFLTSGTEANELALRIAAAHTGRRTTLVVENAYHGHTSRLIELSPYKYLGRGGSGRPGPDVQVVPLADPYRGAHRGNGPATAQAYLDDLQALLDSLPEPPAAFLTESLLSCGGQVVAPEGYLRGAFERVRAAGGVCIADEVQVGFGRVGTHTWAFEAQGARPDVVVLGKPIGNGHPMAAVVTTRAIAESFDNGMEFFSTFGGNPVSCAIGMAVLDVLADEGLQQHALELGAHFRQRLEALAEPHEWIGDVRGLGLFLGVELVRDRTTREPAAEEARHVLQAMRARGVLLATDGPHANVLKIKPPMVLREEDVDMAVRLLDDVLTELGDPCPA